MLALPINLVAGLFGMNVGGIPLAADESGFWVIVCAGSDYYDGDLAYFEAWQ